MPRMPVLFMVTSILALGTAGGAHAQTCPAGMPPLTNWWETDPPYAGVTSIRLELTFRNDHATNDMSFSGITFDLWKVPSVSSPPVTIAAQPAGIVPPGGLFSYDLTVDVSGFPPGDDRLAFRPVDDNLFGTIGPDHATLLSAVISCTAATVAIPTASGASLAVLALMLAGAGVYLATKR